ncbi:RrF2 family transcriptional regulator [Myceligenerans pegani]|uniref:Rrf2 family transcriptional regulator n=1 Tax=Myceligenerans pegani TaxID=2776917 RepID=A0ABR9MX04_9MICO|nr:Rrf2 family transcriptional regulator [Myceligenerans sp. TRM 65318]MBE1875910.1 Rrf2 family transcriptional regulator [Myceligenerans sp. TRM 65318]MBE3018181.1 Rrf2 family transcriptional regulator [Myceligenerans sp. TRM 65318]
MRISARADYAVRAAAELAAADHDVPVRAEALATAQGIPYRFLEGILSDLRRDGLVTSQRGAGGGYRLGQPAERVTIADVIRAVDGPLVFVRGKRPSDLEYQGPAAPLLQVWVALRANVRTVLEQVTLADLVTDGLPTEIRDLVRADDAWANA